MRVADLPLADRYVDHFQAQGIESLYPPQAAAVEAGVCEGESILAAVPTASGKTLIAQLASLTSGVHASRRAEGGEARRSNEESPATVYVVPLRALATEKADTFAALPDTSVGVATGDFDATDDELAAHDVVVATAEKVDAAIRHGARWVQRVECAVLDEVHLLDDASRGPTLEVTIAKLRRLNPDVQLVALSATVPNADEVADWLDATTIHSDWRPVDLRTGICTSGAVSWRGEEDDLPCSDGDLPSTDGGRLSGDDSSPTSVGGDDRSQDDERSETARLAESVLADGGQCLVFVSSRRGARTLASELTVALETPVLPGDDRPMVEAAAEEGSASTSRIERALRQTAETATGEALADVAADGVGFHHAGLRGDHRRIVETGFRNGELGVLCATPTLAAGVNVPARRVVVRDHRRYGDHGYEPLSSLEVHQMFGRAGRPGLDPYGEAILLAADDDERATLAERYLDGTPDHVTSALDDPAALRPHVLSSVATGMVESREDLRALLVETFCAHCGGAAALSEQADATVERLLDAGMLVERADGDGVGRGGGSGNEAGDDVSAPDGSTTLDATPLGALVSQVYVDPETGADVVAALRRADDLPSVTSLTVCEIVCDTAEMPARYVAADEAGGLSEYAMRHEDELAKSVRDFTGSFHDWLSSLKTARLLADYAEGASLSALVEGYAVGPGDVRRYAERAEWLLSATESLSEHVDSDATERIRETRERLADRRS